MLQIFLTQREKEITLILALIEPFLEQYTLPWLTVDNPRIMPSRNPMRTSLTGPL